MRSAVDDSDSGNNIKNNTATMMKEQQQHSGKETNLPNVSNSITPNTYACLRSIANPTNLFASYSNANRANQKQTNCKNHMPDSKFDNIRKSLPYRTYVAWNSCDPRGNCNIDLGLSHSMPLL